MMKKTALMKIIVVFSILLFIISLTQKTYCLDGSYSARGFLNLLIGWLGVLSSNGSKAWLANPFLLASWFLAFRKPKWALALSSIAFVFAIRFYFQDTLIKNEAGMIGKITDYKAGYWLWVSSISVLLVGGFVSILKS